MFNDLSFVIHDNGVYFGMFIGLSFVGYDNGVMWDAYHHFRGVIVEVRYCAYRYVESFTKMCLE